MALALRNESSGRHTLFGFKTIDPASYEIEECTWYQRWFMLGTRADPEVNNLTVNLKESGAARFFQNWY